MRIKESLKNMTVGTFGNILTLAASFLTRTVFIYYLSIEYLGVNALFANMLTLFSLANLGIGSAMSYSLYKPIAKKDYRKVSLLFGVLTKAYKIIGVVILILGLIFFPFLDYFIKGDSGVEYLEIIYIIYLFNYIFPYFCGLSSRSLITAHQKERIFSIANYGSIIVGDIIQIIVLVFTQNFLLFILVKTLAITVLYIYLRYKAYNLYPYIKTKVEGGLALQEKKDIVKNIKGSIYYNFGYVVNNGTDNIVISAFIGITQLGLYANYNFIITSIQSLIRPIFMSLVASIGNLNVNESNAKKSSIFYVLMFSNFWIFGFSAISLFILSSPFISLWIGEQYIIDSVTILIIVINFYVVGMQTASNSYRSAMGLFWHGRHRPIISAAINIILSLTLVHEFGISGVFIGTILSIVLVGFWYDPLIVFRYGLKQPLKQYFLKYFYYICIVLFAGYITMFLSSYTSSTFIGFVYKGFICLIVPNVIFFLVFIKSKELNYILNNFKNIFKKRI